MNYKKEYKKLKADIENAYLFAQTDSTKAVLEHILPELAESDDEKIRKTLIDYFDEANKVDENRFELFGIHTDKVLAWLEKQGEVDNLHNYLYGERNVFYKVGDWIIRSTEGFKHNIYLVTEVKDYYVCEDLKGRRVTFTFNDVHKNFRLWNISDAKDGDVLVDEDNNIGIYRGEKDNFWESYIYLGCNNYLYGFSIGGYHEHKNTKPATKEQRDLLFKKIKESGHEWDTEKKELNKIEQKPADKIEPKFNVGDRIVDNCGYTWKIGGILNQFYILEGVEGGESRPTIEWVDKTCHLWTLKDAKDGDVLVDGDNNIGLYRGEKDDFWESYIYLGCNNILYGPNIGGYHEHRNTKPATKEQRDLLFQKMKEEGYEWDVEKKELKNIEPKFKVGDWIVREYTKDIITINQVVDIKRIDDEHFGYTLDDETYFSGSWESSYHLWTIKDAKDGDVLAVEDKFFATPFVAIYKSLGDTVYGYPTYNSRCFIGFDGNFYTGEGGHVIEGIHPATKEQRDLLFQKMHEAGYEWDVEKKELKKIEQKPDIEMKTPEESLGIDSETYNKIVDECIYGEKNPINEDAEKEKSDYVSGQFLYCKGSFNEFKEGESYWLEYIGNDTYVGRSDNILSQKFHITPRQLYTWLDPRHPENSKEDVPMSYGKELDAKLRDACARYYSNGGDTLSLAGVFYAGVEAQKEIGQKPIGWTEEDEEELNQLHKLIVKKAYEEYEIDTEDETLWGKHAILDNWLKSLKERIKGGH